LAFLALFVNQAYSSVIGHLRQVSVNIRDDEGCGGKKIRLRITRDGQSCTTRYFQSPAPRYSPSRRYNFSKGQTLIFDDWLLGMSWGGQTGCSNVFFDKDSKFSIETDKNDKFCPYYLEFQVALPWNHPIDAETVYISSIPDHRTDKWFSKRTNNEEFPVKGLLEDSEMPDDFTCPANGCPITDLLPYKSTGNARKQCAFRCPNMVKENGEINGQFCYDVSFEVNQLEYCCKNSGTGFPVCAGYGGNPGNDDDDEDDDEDEDEDDDSNESNESNLGNHETTCPSRGCPHSQIRHYGRALTGKECTIICPNVKSNNPNDLNSGIQCVDQPSGVYYEYCCLQGNTGHDLPSCPAQWSPRN